MCLCDSEFKTVSALKLNFFVTANFLVFFMCVCVVLMCAGPKPVCAESDGSP